MAWCVIPSLLTPYLLDKVDEDGNGTLTLTLTLTLTKVDEDGNGTLDLNEFMQASSLLAVVAK